MHVGLFPRLGGHVVSVNLETRSILLRCFVRRLGTRHLHCFDHSGFIPMGAVEVGLGCVRTYVCCPGLDGTSWHIQRRKNSPIRMKVETLSVAASYLEIIDDLIEFFFVRDNILSVSSRGFSSRCASTGGSPTVPSRYWYLMYYHICLLSSRGSPPSYFSWRISHLVVHIFWVSSRNWELSIPIHDVPVWREQPCNTDS